MTNNSIEKVIAKLKVLDKEHLYFVNAKIKCPHCDKEFSVNKEFVGIFTCPYCGKYVKGQTD